jgi:hypothetical protein
LGEDATTQSIMLLFLLELVILSRKWFDVSNISLKERTYIMTIQLLNQHLLELIRIEEKIKGLKELAERQGIDLPEEEVLVGEIIKQMNK